MEDHNRPTSCLILCDRRDEFPARIELHLSLDRQHDVCAVLRVSHIASAEHNPPPCVIALTLQKSAGARKDIIVRTLNPVPPGDTVLILPHKSRDMRRNAA